jgi:hypothetical protein
LLFGEALDGVQSAVPPGRGCGHRLSGAGHDLGGFVEALGADAVTDLAAFPAGLDEPGAGQDGQMLGDRLPGEGQFGGQRVGVA